MAKAVFHTHLSEACPELSQGCQQPSWSPASCLPAADTGAAQRFPAPVQSPTAAVLAGGPEEEAAGLPSGDSGAQGCVCMNLEDKPEEAPDGLPTGAAAAFSLNLPAAS